MGSSEDEGDNEILGMNAIFPNLSPIKILVSITKELQFSTINLVPLQRPSLGAIFHSNIIRQPTLRSIFRNNIIFKQLYLDLNSNLNMNLTIRYFRVVTE